MKKILTKLIILNLTMLWGISYDFSITVSDGEYDRVLTVGVDPGASNGYDVLFDIPAPPLPPSDDVFDTRIISSISPYDFYTDIRSDADNLQIYHITYQSSNNISLLWDNAQFLSAVAIYIQDINGESQIDMKSMSYIEVGENDLLSSELIIVVDMDFLLGDMNEDSGLNILDIVLLANIIMDGIYSFNGDMNSDGGLNVLDIVMLAMIIANG